MQTLKSRLAKYPGLRSLLRRKVYGYITNAYNAVLLRDPEPSGLDHFYHLLTSGKISRAEFLETLRGSEEFRFNVRFTDLLTSLHWSRCDFVRGLPRARHLLDLGGASQEHSTGMFLAMGYPYEFEKLVIVDLPPEEAHDLYKHPEKFDRVETKLGPVFYRYHSMTDLSGFDDQEFDLIYLGQSIEHIEEDEAQGLFEESHRVLKPGGYLCLDTPNARVCRIQQPEFINPDHEVEYTHEQLIKKIGAAGFDILEAKGLNYAGRSVAEGRFDLREVAANNGIYFEIEDCYLLAYVCQKPVHS